jgi:hypothetical protein
MMQRMEALAEVVTLPEEAAGLGAGADLLEADAAGGVDVLPRPHRVSALSRSTRPLR